MSEEEQEGQEDAGLKQDSITVGTAGFNGAIKLYFDSNKSKDDLKVDFDHMLWIINNLQGRGLGNTKPVPPPK